MGLAPCLEVSIQQSHILGHEAVDPQAEHGVRKVLALQIRSRCGHDANHRVLAHPSFLKNTDVIRFAVSGFLNRAHFVRN